MRFAFILAERACWPVVVMCAVLKVSASGFYAWLRSSPSARDKKDERLKVLIGESFAKSRKTYGSPRGARTGRTRRPGVECSRRRDARFLTSLVGGPRRARMFARDLDTWRATLPFGVEVSTASGIKIYRRVTMG